MVGVLFVLTSLVACIEATVLMVRHSDGFCIGVQAMRGDIIGHRFAVYKRIPRDVVNLRIYGPGDQDVISLSDTDGDQLSFKAQVEGPYTLCYENMGKELVTVAFRNVVGKDAMFKESLMKNSAVTTLDKEVDRLEKSSMPVWDELEYYRRRMEFHSQLSEVQLKAQKTFNILKLLLIVFTSLVLVYFISSLFETKRKI